MITRVGDYLWRPVYLDGCSMVQIAYAPETSAAAPELRDIVCELADVADAIVRLVR